MLKLEDFFKRLKSKEEERENLKKFANQTAQNVTFLLDHLLQQYDNSLRPDIRGPPLIVEINMQVRSMGPISEVDMVSLSYGMMIHEIACKLKNVS